MRLKFPILPCLSRAWALLRQVQWRDPLTQTWGLIGGLLIVGIAMHYVRGAGAGENKNSSTAGVLFLENAVTVEAWKPGVPFSPVGTALCAASAPSEPDLRAFADRAARNSGWHYVAVPLRDKLTSVSGSIAGITVTWSGTRGGDASALDLYCTNTRGQRGGVKDDFIIGNGCRGIDGRIESTGQWARTLAGAGRAPESTRISICLVGDGQNPTPAQEAALGELITCIEARTGTTTLAMRPPQTSALLAGKM